MNSINTISNFYFRAYRAGFICCGDSSSPATQEFEEFLREFEESIPEGTYLRGKEALHDGIKFTIVEATGPLDERFLPGSREGLGEAMKKIARNIRAERMRGAALYDASTRTDRAGALQTALANAGFGVLEGESFTTLQNAFGPILTEGFRGAALACDGIPAKPDIFRAAEKVRSRRYAKVPPECV